jgi:hypothetical protein
MDKWYVVVSMIETDIANARVSLIQQPSPEKAIKMALEEGYTTGPENKSVGGPRMRIDAYEVANVTSWVELMGFVVKNGQPTRMLVK